MDRISDTNLPDASTNYRTYPTLRFGCLAANPTQTHNSFVANDSTLPYSVFAKRLIVKTFSRCLIQRIGQCSKSGRECRFTHTCRINIILHKMNVNRLWCFAVTNHAVLVEIVFVWYTIFKCQSSIQCIADGVNDCAFCKVGRCIGIHHNTAVDCTTYSLVSLAYHFQLSGRAPGQHTNCGRSMLKHLGEHLAEDCPSRIFREQAFKTSA